MQLDVLGVVITRFEGQIAAQQFMNKLKRMGVKVYTHKYTKGYPTDVDLIVSDEGYGANDYIETDKKLIVVTGRARTAENLPHAFRSYITTIKGLNPLIPSLKLFRYGTRL